MKLKRLVSIVLVFALLAALAAVPAMAESTMTLTTTGSVNLRKGPGVSYGKITAVAKGKKFTYTGASAYSAGGTVWHKVNYGKGVAWVSSVYSYVSVDGTKLDNKVYVKTNASVNLRKGVGTGYKIVTSVASGTKLFYLGKSAKDSYGRVWYKVACKKGVVWLTSKYSKLSTDNSTGKYVITTASVNLRKGPSTSYAKIVAFAKGTTLNYLGQTKTDKRGVRWFKVSYKNYTGWVSSKYSKIKN